MGDVQTANTPWRIHRTLRNGTPLNSGRKKKTGYILLSFEERRSVLDGTIIGIQDFLKWTGING